MRWPFPIKPYADELLSSFLVRSALRHGLDPYRFCAYHFPNEPLWNRDIDRSGSDALLEAIAEKADLPLKDVVGMTMRGIESRLNSHGLNGTCPWINTIGIYHRLRLRWGLQYCPLCLDEAPAFYRSWRLSFVVACRRHATYLRDACPHCGATLAIHRQRVSSQLCHDCSRPLTNMHHGLHAAPREILWMQTRYENALIQGRSEVGTQAVCADDLFNGVHVLTCLMKPSRPHRPDDRKLRRLALEFNRTDDRAETLLHLEKLLARWPNGFEATARGRNLTQRSFARWPKPRWLGDAVGELPKGRNRSYTKFRRCNDLRSQLEVSRRHDAEWRTARAELLWQAATQ